MKVLLVSATRFEVAPITSYLEKNFETIPSGYFKKNNLEVRMLSTGVGMMQTAYAMTKALLNEEYNLVIHAGIGGAYQNSDLKIGDVVQIISEQYGDLGAELPDESFISIHDLDLIPADGLPFQKGKLDNPTASSFDFLTKAKGVSVNKVTGSKKSVVRMEKDVQADIENMEGIAFFYVCLLEGVDFISIRSVSNYVEERNREGWNLPLAIGNLNETLVSILDTLSEA